MFPSRSLSLSLSLSLSVSVLLLLSLTPDSHVSGQQVILPEPSGIYPTIWPQPYQLTVDTSVPNGGPTLYVNPEQFTVTWDQNCADRNPLQAQAEFIDQKLFPIEALEKQDDSLGELTGLFIHVDCPQCPFSIDNSQATSTETYNISIAFTGNGNAVAQLYAPTSWGAIWGIESFVQLLTHADGNYLLYNSTVSVYDVPRFQYRGVQLDTSHHFMSVGTIHHILDGMSANKLNVLHWAHKSAVAISIQSTAFPELTGASPSGSGVGGSFNEDLASYTQGDVFEIVEYAKNRGIHVVVEHGGLESAAAIGVTHPEIIACPDVSGYPAIQGVALDPTLNATIDFLAAYWHELDQISTDYVHLGGDLVNYTACWSQNPGIVSYLSLNSMSYEDLQAEFITNIWNGVMQQQGDGTSDSIFPLFTNNQSMMYRASTANYPSTFPGSDFFAAGWSSILFEAKDQTTLAAITQNGFDVIYSGSEWDLTAAKTQAKHPVSGLLDVFDEWTDIYLYDIMNQVDPDPSITDFVIGGEVQVITSQIDSENVQSILWPRGSAVAERLWSPESSTSTVDDMTLFRIQSFICTLQRRGLRSQALRPGFCSTQQRTRPTPSSGINLSWLQFGLMIAFSVIGALYLLSVVLSTISHLRAGTKAAVTASLNAPLMER